MPAPLTLTTLSELRNQIAAWRGAGETIALVPTMGALHDGHLSLVAIARAAASKVVTSIFVNPTQFAPGEDLDRYPRSPEKDSAALSDAGCDLIWMPDVNLMYPAGFATEIVPKGAAEGLESDFRPHFFAGVTTVCTKLFNQVTPDIAVFGEKDYQQLAVIRQLVRDIDLPIEIIAAPIVRAEDGLALSSRNRYLDDAERQIAPALFETLKTLRQQLTTPDTRTMDIERRAGEDLRRRGFKNIDYIAIRNAETLAPPSTLDGSEPLRILAAAWLGNTRLIDNIPV